MTMMMMMMEGQNNCRHSEKHNDHTLRYRLETCLTCRHYRRRALLAEGGNMPELSSSQKNIIAPAEQKAGLMEGPSGAE